MIKKLNEKFKKHKSGQASFKKSQKSRRALSTSENRSIIKRNFNALLHYKGQRSIKGEHQSWRYTQIVPKGSMHGFALMVVIAIMSFLAVWTVIAAHFINQSAKNWSSSIARQAVVQIMPVPDQDMEKSLTQAEKIIRSYNGVSNVHIVDKSETKNLLEPWLGSNVDIATLPVPRLITLNINTSSPPNFEQLTDHLQQTIKGVRFDKQQVWASRLIKGAHLMLGGAFLVLALVLMAMGLTIIFASRAALAGNMHIIEVLHLIGADDKFVAQQFDSYFFRTGLKGGSLGAGVACGVFALVFFWINMHWADAGASQLLALFGRMTFSWTVSLEIIILIIAVAFITAFASHYTVIKRLREIDRKSSSFFSEMG